MLDRLNAIEIARRWTIRFVEAYPRPIRPYVRLTLLFIGAMALLFAGLLVVAGIVSFVDWLTPGHVELGHL